MFLDANFLKNWRFWPWGLIFIVAGALALRLFGIWFGLPGTFHADEPHHVNLAVYFGSGDLNPHVFKYPTLWMYFLFFLYGIFFIFWSGFGLARSAQDFAGLFVWDPSWFYLIARGASGFFGAAAVIPVYLAARRLMGSPKTALAAAALAALSPRLVYYSHLAKPDMFMFFWAACGWWLCARVYDGETRWRDYLAAAAALGFAASSQYTAVLISPLLLWAHFLGGARENRPFGESLTRWRWVFGNAAIKAAFFAGTPFALLDWDTFVHDLGDLGSYAQGTLTNTAGFAGRGAMGNIALLVGWPKFLVAIFLAAGFAAWWRRRRLDAIFFAVPITAALIVLSWQNSQAGSERYFEALAPGAILLLAGVLGAMESLPGAASVMIVLLALPGLVGSVIWDQRYCLADTRNLAGVWIEKNIPQGSKLLLDQIHASPPLNMSKEQVARLWDRTSRLDHPRARYYDMMLKSHPGGGYEIWRILRSAGELISMKRHTQWSQQGYDLLDVEDGLNTLREKEIRYVVTSEEGATRRNSPRLRKFFDDLDLQAKILKDFTAGSDLTGPRIIIYEIEKKTQNPKH
ncbi:MAG: DUF2029 domain-containing protein [Elusimicrobia bacterium]|nr:DUF2029 domain-containing protein [Elusimicrobiota bacterium]